jgi:catechol 2,3-dioxygenase-like lactoylglutathione lyase family enzyme
METVVTLGNQALMTRLVTTLLACSFSGLLFGQGTDAPSPRLGNFSVSLAVKDIAKSREFYEKLGFRVVGGNQAKNWLVLQSEATTIGLFQGFFEKNSLTFNPGWDPNKKTLPAFDDVRDIQQTLKSRGLALTKEADASTTGPAYLTLTDPDGNPVLIDQHVPKPGK